MSPHNSGGGLNGNAVEQITQIAHAVFKHASDGLTVSICAIYFTPQSFRRARCS